MRRTTPRSRSLAAALRDAAPGRVLVLGAGAGRLAYDLHMRTTAALTVALDFNPLLLIVADTRHARRLARALRVPARAARRRGRAAHAGGARSRRAPGSSFVLADAHRPPFRRGAFDTVVTPWLIDILPERFDLLCARVNALLGDGGRWLNFGSLSFHDPDPAARYGLEECLRGARGERLRRRYASRSTRSPT